jgi:hypothetical protein
MSFTQIGNFSSIAVVSTLQYSHDLWLFFCSNARSSNRPWIVAAVEGRKDARKKHDNSKSKTQCREKRREGRRTENLVGSGDLGTWEHSFGGNMHGHHMCFILSDLKCYWSIA